ncbi:hypothetical protein M407DRAFT_86190 [Tulasnella calospora MUT 4182]|uniref:Integrase core domain-containing protein n=1 Tax=Tulasnella calospora MUT 4182 TaxID=1051891 RepID=A0A0C3Q178_9AGAM|nr:hypothetical protein M407DRAFT_86190 [Tulasnella calospora MUT 4182]
MPENNPDGNNGYAKQEYPPDDDLREAFERYSRENGGAGLSEKDQRLRLRTEFGLTIGRSKLFEHRKRLKIKSARKSGISTQDGEQAVISLKADDPAGQWGVAAVKQRLALNGVMIPRVPLDALGPWHKKNLDGHEKLNSQALGMGELNFGIYAAKDGYSSHCSAMRVMPNVRSDEAIGHFFLDMTEAYDYRIPIQLMTDKGTEVGEMIRMHRVLRLEAAPEFDLERWPAAVQVPSVRNTPIEGFWRWKRQGEGHSIKHALLIGSKTGIFNPADSLHVRVAQWIWPPLIQERLDIFQDYWNSHKISPQAKKKLPSGKNPRQLFMIPESGRPDAKDCSIRVNPDTVRRLREGIGGDEGRKRAYLFVDDEFQSLADGAYVSLGCPDVTFSTVWEIFVLVVEKLRSQVLPEL